ncbi:MAG: TolC family protein [Bacteroidales bacterium]|nr:TolC family protein [Bacteroidales bacterium]
MKTVLYYPFIFLLTLLFPVNLPAQEKRQWTLEECIDYALENNIDIKSKYLDSKIQERTLHTAKWSRLPNLNANVEQNFDFGRSPSASELSLPENSANGILGINTTVPLFTGFKIPNEIAAEKLNLKATLETLDKAKESLALMVTSNFLDVLFNQEMEKVYTNQVELTTEQVKKTALMVEAGKAPEGQLYEIKATLAKDQLNLVNAQNQTKLTLLALAQNLELGTEIESFSVQAPFINNPTEELLGSILPPADIYAVAVNSRPAIKEQEFLLESSKKNLKVAKSAYYPKLDFSAYYRNAYYHYYTGTQIEKYTFAEQLRNNQRSSLGLSLSIPIFNRFSFHNQVKKSQINILNQELSLDYSKKELFKEIQQAYYKAVAAQKKYDSSKESVEASSKAYEYTEEKYEVGKATVFELNEAKTKLNQSQAEQVQSK